MRISVSGASGGKLPKWREEARKRLKHLPGSISREIRQCVAENMEREALKSAFKALGQKHKTDFRKQEEAYQDAKLEAIREWKKDDIEEGKLDEFDIIEMANRSTLTKAGKQEGEKEGKKRTRKRYKAVKWKSVKRGGKWKREPTHYKERIVVGKHKIKLGKKLIPASNIKKSMANLSYWGRIRALANAMAITKKNGKADLIRARKIDRKMMNVPDNVRRKIYDECVEKAAAGWIGPSHYRGTEMLPASKKELQQQWGRVVARHGDSSGQSRSRRARRSSKRRGNPGH